MTDQDRTTGGTAPPTIDSLLAEAAGLLGLPAGNPLPQPTFQAFLQGALARTLTAWCEQRADLAEPARALLAPLPALVLKLAAAGHLPWQLESHPLRTLLEMAFTTLRGFDHYSGRNSEALVSGLQGALAEAQTADSVETLQACAERCALVLREFQTELQKKEQPLIQKEREQWQRNAARQGVDAAIDQRLAALQLPRFAIDFIETDLRKLLQIIFVQHGADSTLWQELHGCLDALIWSLTMSTAEQLRQEYRERIAQPQACLREQFALCHHNATSIEEFFSLWDEHLFCLMSGMTPDVDWSSHEAGSNEDNPHWVYAEDVLLKARALRVGDWLEIRQHDHWVRARLIDKDLHRGQYLFSNLAGLKIAALDTEALAALLEKVEARIIDSRPLFNQLNAFFAERLEEELAGLRIELAHAQERRQAEQSAAMQEEIRQAKDRLAAERERRQKTIAERAEVQARTRLQQEYLTELGKLKSGAWIELHADDGPCKAQLAVILNRSEELVFVDAGGKKRLQATLASLSEMMLAQKLKILDYGKVLDETLSTLVQNRRLHLNQWQS